MSWGGGAPPMSPPYPWDQNGLGGRWGFSTLRPAGTPSAHQRRCPLTKPQPDPARRLSPLCAGPCPPQASQVDWSAPRPAGVDHPSTAAPLPRGRRACRGKTGLAAQCQREEPHLPESADVHGASHREGPLLLGLRQGLLLAGALTFGAGVTASVLKRQLRPTGGEGVIRRDKPPTEGGAAR